MDEFLQHPTCIHVMHIFNTYLDVLRNDRGPMAGFWMSYLDMVEIVLGLIRASREGNWPLHLAMIDEMIPRCFAYDKQNYGRYLPGYLRQMIKLENEHPQIHDHYTHGGFSVQLGSSNAFGKIPIDQTIEETANKDTQMPGGMKGFSLKAGSISKFYLAAEYRSTSLKMLCEMIQVQAPDVAHADLEPSQMNEKLATLLLFLRVLCRLTAIITDLLPSYLLCPR